LSKAFLYKKERPYLRDKPKEKKKKEGPGAVVEYLFSKETFLSSNPSNVKKQKRSKKNK
jgi:hypothetical protein